MAQAAWAWPDLKVIKTGPTQAAPGDLITYTLTYSNIGPVTSTSVLLKDNLPSSVAVQTNSLGGGIWTNGVVSWNLGSLSSKAGGS